MSQQNDLSEFADNAHEDMSTNDFNTDEFECKLSTLEVLKCASEKGIERFSFMLSAENKEMKIPKNKPILLQKELDIKVPSNNIEYIKFTRKGDLVVNTKDVQTAEEIISIDSLMHTKVKVVPFWEELTSKFTMRNVPVDCNLYELEEQLTAKNDIKIFKIKRFNKKGKKEPTETILITVIGHNLPEFLLYAYQKINISRFYENPRQCTNCYNFQHPTKYCKQEKKCRRCGGKWDPSHNPEAEKIIVENTEMTHAIKCSNCQEEHEANSKECSIYLNEVKVIEYCTDNHIPFNEGRKQFYLNQKKKQYSTVTQSQEPVSRVELNKILNTFANDIMCAMNNVIAANINLLTNQFMEIGAKIVQSIQGNTVTESHKRPRLDSDLNQDQVVSDSAKYISINPPIQPTNNANSSQMRLNPSMLDDCFSQEQSPQTTIKQPDWLSLEDNVNKVTINMYDKIKLANRKKENT